MWNSNGRLFGGEHVVFFGFARFALLYAFDLLGLRPGEKVLVPSYICDSVLSPFNHRGIGTILYPIKEDLQVDLDQVEALVDEHTRALLAVNYFGFPQNYQVLKSLCARKGLFLIEDNAHGFLSGDAGGSLGRHGDVSICSFRKNLILPNGAALVINSPTALRRATEVPRPQMLPPPAVSEVKAFVKALDLRMGGHLVHFHRNRARLVSGLDGESGLLDEESDINPFRAACSRYSRLSVRLLSIPRFQQARRAKYAFWSDYYSGSGSEASPLWGGLPEGVVPLVFPVRAENPAGHMARLLAEKGVQASLWPRLPRVVRENLGDYPRFYRRVVTIPLGGELGRYKCR